MSENLERDLASQHSLEMMQGQRVVAVDRCPVCNSSHAIATGRPARGFETVIANRVFSQPSYLVRECKQCGLLYRTRRLSSAELMDYYAQVDHAKWEPVSGFFPTERAVLAQLENLPSGARILDFGCSTGRLLRPLTGKYECYGIEINASARAQAFANGLHVIDSENWSDRVEQFDAVLLVDVFEHLPEPFTLLRNLYRLLKKDGRLIISTGNGDSKTCRLDPAQFWYFRTVEHLCMLTRRTTQFLAQALPARFETWQLCCHYRHPFSQRLKEYLQHVAYWTFQERSWLLKFVFSVTPFLRRARRWRVAPAFTCSRDHVVVVFRKMK